MGPVLAHPYIVGHKDVQGFFLIDSFQQWDNVNCECVLVYKILQSEL